VSVYDYEEFDSLGRVKRATQRTAGQAYRMSYGYDLAGNMLTETYPSGRTLSLTYDSAGRVSQLSGAKTGEPGRTYAAGLTYTAHGAIASVSVADWGMTQQTSFNSRLQPGTIELRRAGSLILGLDYTYTTTPTSAENNGNILSQTIRIGGTTPATITQSYQYDEVNRLEQMTEAGGWSQTYGYDRYGNRWVSAGDVPNPELTPRLPGDFNGSTNRLTASLYDAAGNERQNAANESFGYDGENRLISFNSGAATYSYDGDGRRVMKVVGAVTTVFVYNILGQLIAEYQTPDQPVVGEGGTSYLTTDHLGSTRVVTNAQGQVNVRYDYLPFGEEIPSGVGGRTAGMGYGGADATRQKFTQKERDAQTGLDHFGARYYSSAGGRFIGCDPVPVTKENFVNPQRWNLYVYVNNNPLASVDPNGGDGEGTGGDKVISVFLVMSNSDRNTVTRAGKTTVVGAPDWQATRDVAAKNGYDVQVFGSRDVAGEGASAPTGAAFETALKNSEVVVYVDHGVGDRGNVPFIPIFIEVDGRGYYSGGTGQVVEQDGGKILSPTGGRPETSASVVCNFSCNSSANSAFFEYKGTGQIQVTVSGGRDGYTTVGTLERAANAFVKAYAKSKGSTEKRVKAGIAAANRVIREDRKRRINRGDRVESTRVNYSQEP
jgi:RHS repeat-associated protein